MKSTVTAAEELRGCEWIAGLVIDDTSGRTSPVNSIATRKERLVSVVLEWMVARHLDEITVRYLAGCVLSQCVVVSANSSFVGDSSNVFRSHQERSP